MVRGLRNDERGVALVVSMMVVTVVFMLATVIYSQVISSSGTAAYDRKRVQSIGAAEAGLDYYSNLLQKTPLSTSGYCNPVSQSFSNGSGRNSTFTVTPTFYDVSGTQMLGCSFSSSNYPTAVKIASRATWNFGAPRQMESWVNLHPIFSGFQAAIIVDGAAGLTLGNNMTLNGNVSNDADIYVNSGPLTITNSPTISEACMSADRATDSWAISQPVHAQRPLPTEPAYERTSM